ncbi:hypothetical protein SMZ43_003957 [Cronobacter dublinensis]|nr:hypothetical protein [Cronobacter dublinensis]
MSTISNERLDSIERQFIEDGFNDITDSEVAKLVSEVRALRKERAEPVAWRWRWSDDAEGDWRYTEERRETRGSVTAVPLYTTPPAQTVALPNEVVESLNLLLRRSYFRRWVKEPRGYVGGSIPVRDLVNVVLFADACRYAMLHSGNDEIGSWSNPKNTPTDKPKSEMGQKAEQLLRDTTALASKLSAETDTTSQQFESLAGKAVVPEGWKLVPVEPTKEMVAKMRYHNGGYDKHIKNGYAAMLAVAPEPCK